MASSVNGTSTYLGFLSTIDGVTGGLVLTGAVANGIVTRTMYWDGAFVLQGTITANGLNVSQLSAITADLGRAAVLAA